MIPLVSLYALAFSPPVFGPVPTAFLISFARILGLLGSTFCTVDPYTSCYITLDDMFSLVATYLAWEQSPVVKQVQAIDKKLEEVDEIVEEVEELEKVDEASETIDSGVDVSTTRSPFSARSAD